MSKRREKYRERNTNNEINVLAQVNINPEYSSRFIASQCGITASGVQKILKKYKFHDYKFQRVQKLHPGDSERRLTFCNWYQRMINANPNFCNTILWTDETTFTNSGMFNRKNKHFYAVANPHLFQETKPQIRYSINLWCGIIGNHIIGPKFIERNLNGVTYVNLLTEALEEMPLAALRNIEWLMQDGCAAHNSAIARDFLDTNFLNRWIGTRGPVRWPPRSPCLNPLDYFLWGFLKNKVYYVEINTVGELRHRITMAFRDLTHEFLSSAVGQLTFRCQKCIENNGGHFEQEL